MSDPITHTVNASPWFVATATGVSSYIFGLPFGVLIAAAGGAYWATYRKPYPGIMNILFQVIAGMCIAAIMVEGAEWIANVFLGIPSVPQRPLAFALGFAVIDKPFRDKVIGFFSRKAETIEVQRHD